METVSDEQLVARYLDQRDEPALEELVRRYLGLVFVLARKFTGNPDVAADIAQETFVKAWKNLARFDQTKNFKAWLLTIARHTALDELKRKKARPFLDLAETLADPTPSVFENLANLATAGELQTALARISASYVGVINLHIRDDLTFREIAQRLGEPLNTVKSRYRRGLALLKKILHQNG